MKLSASLLSELTPLLSFSMVLVIIVLMLVISIRLFLNRRKKAYLSMTCSLFFLAVHYVLKISFAVTGLDTPLTSYISIVLELVSFILVNKGIYQLYNIVFI